MVTSAAGQGWFQTSFFFRSGHLKYLLENCCYEIQKVFDSACINTDLFPESVIENSN